MVGSKNLCISTNQQLITEADRRLAKIERDKKLAIEASEAKAKEEKLAELEKELKINREGFFLLTVHVFPQFDSMITNP